MKTKDKAVVDSVIDNLEKANLSDLASYIWLKNKGKTRDINKMVQEIERVYLEKNNAVKAVIVSQSELEDSEKQEIISKLETSTNKKISAEYKTDKSIIGGIKIIFASEVIDYSLKGRVDALRDKIRG